MRKHIIQNYRKKSRDKSAIPTFKESVDFVIDELKKMESGSSKIMQTNNVARPKIFLLSRQALVILTLNYQKVQNTGQTSCVQVLKSRRRAWL